MEFSKASQPPAKRVDALSISSTPAFELAIRPIARYAGKMIRQYIHSPGQSSRRDFIRQRKTEYLKREACIPDLKLYSGKRGA